MRVDETRHERHALHIELPREPRLLPASPRFGPERGDLSVLDEDIESLRRHPSAVDHGAVLDQQWGHGRFSARGACISAGGRCPARTARSSRRAFSASTGAGG